MLASLGGSDRVTSANRDFYFQASDELVTLPIAGYDYGSNWTISADGTFTHKNNSVIRCTRSVRAHSRIRLLLWMHGGKARRDRDAAHGVEESIGSREDGDDPILDNLLSQRKAVPMLLVMPNGYRSMNGIGNSEEGTEVMGQELMREIIPFIEKQLSSSSKSGKPGDRGAFRWAPHRHF